MRRRPRLAIIAAFVAIIVGLFVAFGLGRPDAPGCRQTTGDGICVDQPTNGAGA